LPDIKCDSFSGEGVSNLEFHSFISQFDNIIGLRTNLTNSIKFTYLRSYLRGYALKLVQHLQITDQNYLTALDLLKSEFLNKPALVEDLLQRLLDLKPKPDQSLLETKIFINEIRCLVSDLQAYEYDFLNDKAGNILISHIIFHKLPTIFQQEIVRKLNDNHPSLQAIFDNYADIVRTINLKSSKHASDTASRPPPSSQSSKWPDRKISSFQSKTINRSNTVKQYKPSLPANNSSVKQCKFCNSTGHTMYHCKKYSGLESRKSRCSELNLCHNCTSKQHTADNCRLPLDFQCYDCGSTSHISALCTGQTVKTSTYFCSNSASDLGGTYLLPFISITVGYANKSTKIRCLLDFGSQRSYVSPRVLELLNICEKKSSSIMINTFVDSACRDFLETSVSLHLGNQKFVLPVLVNDEFDLSFCVNGLPTAHDNISQRFNLTEKIRSENVVLDGLLGVDALQCFADMQTVDCLGGKAIKLPFGIVPYGNVDNFLTGPQLESKYANSRISSGTDACVDSSTVNFVLNPVKSYFDPISSVISDSVVESNLDKMFSAEAIGIEEDISDFDKLKIEEFTENIEKIDGYYNVHLPWNDNIAEVKSNYSACVGILDRVLDKLNKAGLYEEYNDVLDKQLCDSIIEEVSLEDVDVNDHVWIPHRPVIRESGTTKLRVVLNCSLKLGGSPSLNEAAYPGVDLLTDLFQLLIKTRGNDYLVMSDIKSAFLMIKLSKLSDRNKFSILWRDKDGKLIAYRYKTIVFGYISSPFILNYVIKHHLNSFPSDLCNEILYSNMYVDNLFFTGDDSAQLHDMYNECYSRMQAGGFHLRSWCTNCSTLQPVFVDDGVSTDPDDTAQKLLGYKYVPEKDVMMINNPKIDKESSLVTKRKILSEISCIFDPLGLGLPVTVKAKLLLREVWASKVEWDVPISPKLAEEWVKVRSELASLQAVEFPRKAYAHESTMYVFCDSSKECYGFSVYLRDESNGTCRLLFAKAKTAPLKSRTVPTLELLSVHLALKCLPSLLSPLRGKIKDIIISVDAQVVLTWLLTGKVKTKNVFARNRIKDIAEMRQHVKEDHNLEISFRYIPTDQNPADLVTRGLSFKDFQVQKSLWLHGPKFLNLEPVQWPVRSLGCLSAESKVLALNITNPVECALPVDKYSNVNKLFNVVSLVLRFITKARRKVRTRLELLNNARALCIKQEQSRFFAQEIEFLSSDKISCIPPLVRNLNIFVDDQGLLRTRGRYDQCKLFPYNIANPIVLPRQSNLTRVLIEDTHVQQKHLGVASTLAALRKKGLWVPRGRATVRSVLINCIACKN